MCDITKETRGSQVASVVPTVSCDKKEVSQKKKKKDSIFILIFKMTLITLLDVCNEVPVSFSGFFFLSLCSFLKTIIWDGERWLSG